MMKISFLTSVVVALSLLVSTSGAAQPWVDCDTIRFANISLHLQTDSTIIDAFEEALDSMMEQTGIPMKLVTTRFINDEMLFNYYDQVNTVSEFLQNDFDLDYLVEEIMDSHEPDVIMFAVKSIASSSLAVMRFSNDFPKRGYFSHLDNMDMAIYGMANNIAYSTGFTGPDNSEYNLLTSVFWPGQTTPTMYLTPETVDTMNARYRAYSLRPNDLRDCSDLTSSIIGKFNDVNLKFFPDHIDLYDLEESLDYRIINPVGQTLKSGQLVKGNQQIWFDGIDSGIYYLTLNGKQIQYSKGIFIW